LEHSLAERVTTMLCAPSLLASEISETRRPEKEEREGADVDMRRAV
jgi:hypothetical protein